MDFNALKAKFQEEPLPLIQPRMKPVLPDKPRVVPPPNSPTRYLPAGARPSLLTTINQTLDGRAMAPRVVFKDDKKESKKPLIKTTSMEKREGKIKVGKNKLSKGSKEPLDENSLYQKLKKEEKAPSVTTEDLVPVPAVPKSQNTKKKGFLGLKWSGKSQPDEVAADPILDSPTLEELALNPLIPIPPEFDDVKPESEILPLNSLSSPYSDVGMPISRDLTTSPSLIPDIPAPHLPSPQSETPPETETPTPPISILDRQGKISLVQTPQDIYQNISIPSPEKSPHTRHNGSPGGINIAAMLQPRNLVENPPSVSSSISGESSVSALSFLERAEDMSQVKRTTSADQRILNALKNARRKPSLSSQTKISVSNTPPPEELPESPNVSLTDILPVNYNSGIERLNSIDGGQPQSVLESPIVEGGKDIPELLDVPSTQPRNVLPDRAALGVPPEKPAKPTVVKIPNFNPPSHPMQHNEIPVPSKLPEKQSTNEPKFGGVAPSHGLAVSQLGNREYTFHDIPDGNSHKPSYSNGIALTSPKGVPVFGQQPYQANVHVPTSEEGQAIAGHQVHNSVSTGGNHEDVYWSAKKKQKTEMGKKKKGPPKNPYAEPPQDINEDNDKTSLFGKGDKKSVAVVAEGQDNKELKRREKQRLEKEKKELKEKQEREKKEQKERDKRKNEMKKKFKITGKEEPMYQATVTVTAKGSKSDLPVHQGDNISIIRTANCPKGKWLARDLANNYGYVAVEHVELDIKEMLELKNKVTGSHVSSPPGGAITIPGSGNSKHFQQSTASFSDDSEEWTADEDDAFSSPTDTIYPHPLSQNHALSMSNRENTDLHVTQQHSHGDINAGGSDAQGKNEALQKLATFFQSPKAVQPTTSRTAPETMDVPDNEHAVHQPEAMDFNNPDLLILPPPELYADFSG
ncbi:uncharacterized protein LOC130919440 isoform X2 [Corythoichthys intestinalis]|nr:uncharacterized protein LOC130919440 isoform X2 [Corythoichthys intestinalis]XP_057698146.1 uncharacterized protein LOC130919440 isoform X2 [Corythoichthys intestinalis]XP_057698148.1 uncharacterized protein LOC130919440 isoform X2 [Corythoichthys intestinalis]